jgi:hypothetical protein
MKIKLLVVFILIFLGVGIGVGLLFFLSSSLPSKEKMKGMFKQSIRPPNTIDLTEAFFDNSYSVAGYHSEQFLRKLKSYIRKMGHYNFYALSNPSAVIRDDAWGRIEERTFYDQSSTEIHVVLDHILNKIQDGNREIPKTYLIITDGIQSRYTGTSDINDYSRLVDKILNLIDIGLHFQLIAVKLPFDGTKYPERGGGIDFEGDSPFFCLVFTYQPDYGRNLFRMIEESGFLTKFLEFGSMNIDAQSRKFNIPSRNRDGSKNAFSFKYKSDPLCLISLSNEKAGTLLMTVSLNATSSNLDFVLLRGGTPEFCGECLVIGSNTIRSKPDVEIIRRKVEQLTKGTKSSFEAEYELFFKNWDRKHKVVACDITFYHWPPLSPPDWVNDWSSDCDWDKGCFEGKTPFLKDIIAAILNGSIKKYTFDYVIIKNGWF